MQIDIAREVREALKEIIPELKAELARVIVETVGDRLLTVEEAAGIVGVSPKALRKRIERGTVPAIRLGRSIRVRRSALFADGSGAPHADG